VRAADKFDRPSMRRLSSICPGQIAPQFYARFFGNLGASSEIWMAGTIPHSLLVPGKLTESR
jgi:hypothetical protein